jgi:hypothetical protein
MFRGRQIKKMALRFTTNTTNFSITNFSSHTYKWLIAGHVFETPVINVLTHAHGSTHAYARTRTLALEYSLFPFYPSRSTIHLIRLLVILFALSSILTPSLLIELRKQRQSFFLLLFLYGVEHKQQNKNHFTGEKD